MPRAKKYVTKLQALTGDDLEEQLGRTIIIHPGSRYIRMARPLDREAVVLCHCIARKQRSALANGGGSATKSAPHLPESFRNLEAYSSTKEFKQAFSTTETWLKENSNEEKTIGRIYCSFDAKESEEAVPVTKEYVVGNNALDVAALNNNYSLSWPLRYGRFNLHDGPGGSRAAVVADLENIWDGILVEELDVPRAKRADYRAVLLIPDVYDRDDVRCMVDLLLVNLEFFAVFIALENVASMFGGSIASACVVDVGAEKTSISCVDDGISLPDTRLLLHYGGDDITRLSNWFLHQKLRTFSLNLTNMTEWFKMDAVKKSLCHFDYSESGSNDLFVNLPSPDREESVQMKLPHDFCRLPGLTLFFEGLVSPTASIKMLELSTPYEGCGEDIYGGAQRNVGRKFVVAKKMEKIEVKEKTNAADISQDSKDNSAVEAPIVIDKFEIPDSVDQTKLMDLHRAIFLSISKCSSEEQQKRMLKNILVVGGGFALFPGALEFLKKKIEELIPSNYEMIISGNSREIPADLHAFKGASIMAALETVQYLWITKEEWMRNGVKILREKSSFGW